MKHLRPLMIAPLVFSAVGCASYDQQDVTLLGGATDHNIALHSVRDVDLPNELAVEGGRGGSGADAVGALRAGKRQGASPRGGNS